MPICEYLVKAFPDIPACDMPPDVVKTRKPQWRGKQPIGLFGHRRECCVVPEAPTEITPEVRQRVATCYTRPAV